MLHHKSSGSKFTACNKPVFTEGKPVLQVTKNKGDVNCPDCLAILNEATPRNYDSEMAALNIRISSLEGTCITFNSRIEALEIAATN